MTVALVCVWGGPRPGAQRGGCCAHMCGGLGAGPGVGGSAVVTALLAPSPSSAQKAYGFCS